MRILLIPSWYPSSKNSIVGSFFQDQANVLDKNGYEVRVLWGRIIFTGCIRSILDFFARRWSSHSFLSTNYLIQEPPAFSFEVRVWKKLPERLRFYLIFNCYLTAYRSLIDEGWAPDLVHAQSTLDAGIIAHHLNSKTGVPFVIIEHQVFLLHRLTRYKQNLALGALKYAQKVGVVSEHQRKMVLMHQPDCEPTVLWNYANDSVFKLNSTPHKLFTIITITYPAPIKDVRTFFLALKELSGKCNDFRFIIVGNSSFKDLSRADTAVYESISRELDIYQFGTYIPYLAPQGICELLNESDVFVCSSIAETFGLAAREAMLCGLPVVTSACGGVEDSINENTGIVVPIRSPSLLADAILRVKNREFVYSPEYIRNFVIDQCGKNAFIKSMNSFYHLG